MKKYREVFMFAVFILLLICIIQYLLDAFYIKRAEQKYVKIFRHEIDDEVLIFGSSVASHGIDPAIISKATGYAVYNMGSNGIRLSEYDAVIREYLSYQKKCKCIIIDDDLLNLIKMDKVVRFDLFCAFLNNPPVYQSLHAIEPNEIFLARYLPGYKFTMLNPLFYKDIIFNVPDKLNGFEPIIEDSFHTLPAKPVYINYDERVLGDLKTLIEQVTQKGIKVIIMMSPFYEKGYQLYNNTDIIKDKYKSLVNKNVCFIDYTEDPISKNRDNYYDYKHLNHKGATLFSNMLAHDLQKVMAQE